MFASRKLGKKDVAGSYYGLLAYAAPGWELRSEKQYGKRCMEVTVEPFSKCATDLKRKVSDSTGQQ